MLNIYIMKKIIFIVAILLVSCKRTESSKGVESEIVATGSHTFYTVVAVDYYTNGMHYKVFNSEKGNLFVINITKDSLDISNATKR